MGQQAVSLEALRARIRALEGGARIQRRRVSSGIDAIDNLTGGLPQPGILELQGAEGSGRTRLALALAARHTQQRRCVAWLDLGRSLYPPTAAKAGVELQRLLIVRPTADGLDSGDWAAEQLLRSGCFPMVCIHIPASQRGQRWSGQRWARAAEKGQCTAVVIRSQGGRDIPADLRLSVSAEQLVVTRDRQGAAGGHEPLPSPPSHLDPWW